MVHLALIIAALNDLEVKVEDVLNTFIQSFMREKVQAVLCPKFCNDTQLVKHLEDFTHCIYEWYQSCYIDLDVSMQLLHDPMMG